MSNLINKIGLNLLGLLDSENYSKYWAHKSAINHETLYEHSALVLKYAKNLISKQNLNAVIDSLINDLVIEYYSIENSKVAKEFIAELFNNVFVFHDIGKINPNFQDIKMNNEKFYSIQNSLNSDHSKMGAFTFIYKHLAFVNQPNYSGKEKIFNIFLICVFSFPILKHHSSSLTYSNEYDYSEEFVNDVYNIISKDIFSDYSKDQILNIGKNINKNVLSKIDEIEQHQSFPLFALLKLNYSLLTASDYYATTHYMNCWAKIPDDFGVFNNELKQKIISNIETSTSYNLKTYTELENYKLEFPIERSSDNLNKLRQNLSVEIISGIRSNINRNLFYIEAPTGGGKTNLSMLALAEFLRADIRDNKYNLTKVFYVFPFTTLITQTFRALKETLGLEEDEIVQIHSKAGFSSKSNNTESDAKYGYEKENIIDYQFVNYPIALLSHIKFFDILKSNKKSDNYLLHRLANSVVIIDELQTYSPKEWDKVIYFINQYAKFFNIKFILMSATLPKIDKLLSNEAISANFIKEEFVVLNKNKDKYFTNPNFANRVEFDFEMIENPAFDKENKEEYLYKLWDKLLIESELYKQQSNNNRVHTIIEFIFKKTASEFIEIANIKNQFFDEIFILSGTTLEPRRREIISKLKSNKYKSKNVLLITTQVVEAGVDIDMDLGFKDSSLIDSDEQLAGRINRNVNKPMCKLFIFDYDDAEVIYGKDYRYKKMQNELKSECFEILKTKNFDKVYDSVIADRVEINKSIDYINLNDYLKSMKNLDFTSVDNDFKLIDNSVSNTSLYIAINIPISIPESTEKNFTDMELDFLKRRNLLSDFDEFVSGENVWELYCSIIRNKEEDFIKQKINIITLQGLVSKFSFSVATYSKAFKNIESSGKGKEEYGFYKLNYIDDIYDYETGLKTLKFEDINFI